MNVKLIAATVLAGVMVAGCGNSKSDKAEDVMAISVNGEKLMQSAIDADVEAVIAKQGDKIPAEQLEFARKQIANQLVQGFLFEKVLGSAAKSAGYAVTEADRKAREEEYLKAFAKAKDPKAPKTLTEVFAQHPFGEQRAKTEFEVGILIDKMIKAEKAKAPKKDYRAEAKRIVDGVVSNNAIAAASGTEALKKIKELKAQLDKVPAAELGAKFAELAKANSACPSSQKGGDLGEFTHGQMVPEFDEVAFKLPVNKVSDPVKTKFGYHLVMVTKKTPAVAAKGDKPAAPEKVQASHILIKTSSEDKVPKMDEVVKMLEQNDERSFVREFVTKQMKAAKIEASAEYRHFLPPTDEPTGCKDAGCDGGACEKKHPVEKPAAK